MTFFYVAALLAVLIFWFFLRKRDATPKRTAGSTARPERRMSQEDTAYHAVSIRSGRRKCDAVKALEGQRILGSDAPRLPLPGCDIVDCECSYVHYEDRRAGKDRRSPFGTGTGSPLTGTHEQERRSGDERRHDKDDF